MQEVRHTTSASSQSPRVPEQFHELAEFAMLASQPDPFDPMDRAIRKLGDEALQGTEHLHASWKVVREYPLAKSLLAISEVWTSPDSSQFVIATKGAPEAIADLCHLSEQDAALLNETVAGMASEGLRVLGVAKAQFSSKTLPDQQHDFDFEFLGLSRPGRSGPAHRTQCSSRMPNGGNPGDHDYRRLPRHGHEHRAPDRPRKRRWGDHGSGSRGDG